MSTRKKSLSKVIEKNGCVLCKRSNVDELDFGGLLSSKTLQAHYFCLLLSETIKQSGQDNQGIWGFLNSDIVEEVNSSRNKQCHYCNEFGATLTCNRKNCKRKFHLPCGLMNRSQHDFEKFVVYCHAHRKSNNVPIKIRNSIGDYKCLICLENYNSRRVSLEHLVWADCCKKDVVLHIACVKKLALSAGYFTKCPACNNNEEFINTIKKYGVFVPERDASWERDRNAFGELLHRHNKCDAESCICPRGRNYKSTSGNWKIILCQLCGSFGSHRGCNDMMSLLTCKTCTVTRIDNNAQSLDSVTNVPRNSENIVEQSSESVKDGEDSCPSVVPLSIQPNECDGDIVYITSDSDDHFSEREPDSPLHEIEGYPKYSVCKFDPRKRKSEGSLNMCSVAKKKTVYVQSRNHRYEPQITKKLTSNKIYYDWSHNDEKCEDSNDTHEPPLNSLRLQNSTKKEIPEQKTILKSGIANSLKNKVSYNVDSANFDIESIKNIINSNLEKPNCLQIFSTGPIIFKCLPDAYNVEIDNNNEVEIVSVLEGTSSQRKVSLVKPKGIETIVIDDSDEENFIPKTSKICSLKESEKESESNSNETERLSTSGIFENSIRSTNKDILISSRLLHDFNCFKRTKKIVKLDFTLVDSIGNQRYLPP